MSWIEQGLSSLRNIFTPRDAFDAKRVEPPQKMLELQQRAERPNPLTPMFRQAGNIVFPGIGNAFAPLANRALNEMDVQDDLAWKVGERVTDKLNPFVPTPIAAGAGALAYTAANLFDGTPGVNPAMVFYHGSPHKFGKFSMDKIGTGEGAQAYGHGLYFAENEGTGRFYQKELAKEKAIFEDPTGVGHRAESFRNRLRRVAEENGAHPSDAGLMADETYLAMLDGDSFSAHRKFLENDSGESAEFIKAYNAVMDEAEKFKLVTPPGQLYTVDIPDEAVDRMLDWDAPLRDQPRAVRDAINRVARDVESYGLDKITDDMRGVELKRVLQDPRAVQRLKELGVPGIKYYDGGSRAAGEGTRNVVVFDDSIIKVLSRNGEPVE